MRELPCIFCSVSHFILSVRINFTRFFFWQLPEIADPYLPEITLISTEEAEAPFELSGIVSSVFNCAWPEM